MEQLEMDVPSLNGSMESSGFKGLGKGLSSSSSTNHAPKDSSPLGWPLGSEETTTHVTLQDPKKLTTFKSAPMWKENKERRDIEVSEVELMKEKFSRLLLGEDMSGGGRGVCTALAISNAITNLSASVFGELWRLEPLAPERKMMWCREMGWLLSVTDHIVEFSPQWQKCSDGSSTEVMVSTPRSDLHINLPALKKLDALLLDTLDSFTDTEFWYSDKANAAFEANQENIRTSLPRQEEKWWLPTPILHVGGLSDESRKRLQQQREATSQILKAAMAINAQVLSEMEVPDAYIECLPKNGRTSLGELIYRNITSEQFSPDALLASLDLSTEHDVLELANSIEVAIQVWVRKIYCKQVQPMLQDSRITAKSWRSIMKDHVVDTDRRRVLVDRAETLLLTLKLRFPSLPQTSLDTSKIQFNRDVGQSILESYSRVLESLAFNILSRIDDVLHADQSSAISFPSPPPVHNCVSTLKNDFAPAFDNPLFDMTPVWHAVAAPAVNPPVKASAIIQTSEIILPASSAGNTLADYMKFEALTMKSHVNDACATLQKPSPMEMNNWSHARNVEIGKALHSPLGRD
ncbi:hypothetical protein O6H91_03G066300 [Diphasiastrum complanatum]|uniref:Uncharacterized protein n=3 Tax=Diphasiastrum complanatum TaxID=34168 RepID=A0ACC2E719_DIPCM|nr:hypothetical protein O6H91_03G066300 [Diphasiastrum complanatum]KAJ7562365.1 hypothetical protein O6H91_03G066300 [Diphasiastrum complanatum]KAJ7562366.1 hypothetical protein O6H91_03G066300 [Diphasiastrum complanatum]